MGVYHILYWIFYYLIYEYYEIPSNIKYKPR